jgi:hypothetical protein
MTKTLFGLLCVAVTHLVAAAPNEGLVQTLNPKVLRVQVGLANGAYGLGSGVVVAKDQVVTNCHVIANATSISVVSGGSSYQISAIKPDWKHDVCILKADGLPLEPVVLGNSEALQYEQSVFTIGYPSFIPVPTSTYGVVKGLFPMDDSVIVRATSSFNKGSSGGGIFDDQGQLVGITTLKSPGKNAYYYNMSVTWVKALLTKDEQPIVSKGPLPFWAEASDKWPYFMRVVHPYLTQDWKSLQKIAQAWTQAEPHATEAWFYLAAAEFSNHEVKMAEQHLHRVIAMNSQHSQAFYYLGLIAEESGKHTEALDNVAVLNQLDQEVAEQLKVAMRMH